MLNLLFPGFPSRCMRLLIIFILGATPAQSYTKSSFGDLPFRNRDAAG